MNEVYLLSSIIDGKKQYLRYGENGGGVDGYCVYLGKIVCFETNDEAQEVRSGFDNLKSWDVERFVR